MALELLFPLHTAIYQVCLLLITGDWGILNRAVFEVEESHQNDIENFRLMRLPVRKLGIAYTRPLTSRIQV